MPESLNYKKSFCFFIRKGFAFYILLIQMVFCIEIFLIQHHCIIRFDMAPLVKKNEKKCKLKPTKFWKVFLCKKVILSFLKSHS